MITKVTTTPYPLRGAAAGFNIMFWRKFNYPLSVSLTSKTHQYTSPWRSGPSQRRPTTSCHGWGPASAPSAVLHHIWSEFSNTDIRSPTHTGVSFRPDPHRARHTSSTVMSAASSASITSPTVTTCGLVCDVGQIQMLRPVESIMSVRQPTLGVVAGASRSRAQFVGLGGEREPLPSVRGGDRQDDKQAFWRELWSWIGRGSWVEPCGPFVEENWIGLGLGGVGGAVVDEDDKDDPSEPIDVTAVLGRG